MTGSDLERFLDAVTLEPDGCWRWTKATSRGGYGVYWRDGRLHPAHRASYELLCGEIPAGLQLDHLCRNRWCVNPAHLEPVTQRENILRGVSVAAARARQTHCVRGHEFTPENITRATPSGKGRRCKTCAREHMRRQREKNRALAA